MPQSSRDRKASQRAAYHSMWKKFKFGHGSGLSIKKKEQSALGNKGNTTT